MSRFNPSGTGATSSGALWSAPISSQQQQQQAAEDQWRYQQQQNEQRYQQEQQQAAAAGQQPYYDDDAAQQYQQPDYDIYNKACAVSSPRLAGVNGEIDPRATITKTVMRRVEVPFTRSVQVPTQVSARQRVHEQRETTRVGAVATPMPHCREPRWTRSGTFTLRCKLVTHSPLFP